MSRAYWVKWFLFAISGGLIGAGAWKFFELGHWAFGSGLVMAMIALIAYRVVLEPPPGEPTDQDRNQDGI